ncbi:hypothetical protein AB0N79_37830 [Streptomyces microflavus]|uniref:hypothetical protein n=1 Tax=Streptomyces microflavus TaxID=1919 RepID=UPI0033E22A1E
MSFRLALGGGAAESGYLTGVWENREAALAMLEPAGIGAVSVLTRGTATYMALTRERGS